MAKGRGKQSAADKARTDFAAEWEQQQDVLRNAAKEVYFAIFPWFRSAYYSAMNRDGVLYPDSDKEVFAVLARAGDEWRQLTGCTHRLTECNNKGWTESAGEAGANHWEVEGQLPDSRHIGAVTNWARRLKRTKLGDRRTIPDELHTFVLAWQNEEHCRRVVSLIRGGEPPFVADMFAGGWNNLREYVRNNAAKLLPLLPSENLAKCDPVKLAADMVKLEAGLLTSPAAASDPQATEKASSKDMLLAQLPPLQKKMVDALWEPRTLKQSKLAIMVWGKTPTKSAFNKAVGRLSQLLAKYAPQMAVSVKNEFITLTRPDQK